MSDTVALDFIGLVQSHRDGALSLELSESLGTLVKACLETGKAGEMGLSIKVTPQPNNQGIVVQIDPKVAVKAPRFDQSPSVFFVRTDASGQPLELVRENPAQIQMFEGIRKEKG